jgi:hypothetical protein
LKTVDPWMFQVMQEGSTGDWSSWLSVLSYGLAYIRTSVSDFFLYASIATVCDELHYTRLRVVILDWFTDSRRHLGGHYYVAPRRDEHRVGNAHLFGKLVKSF